MAREEAAARKQKCEPTSAAFPLALLNDDILTEIFLRLPYPSTLLRCALTNKRHLRLISDPTFLRRFRHLHPGPLPLLGCFFHPDPPFLSHISGASSYEPLPCFVPIHHPDLAAASRAVRFAPPREGGGGGSSSSSTPWSLADCANGLLLLHNEQRHQLAVIDPLAARRQFLLPCPPSASVGPQFKCYLIVPEGNDDNELLFQVLCIENRSLRFANGEIEPAMVFSVFSSSNGEWRKSPCEQGLV